MRDLLFDRELLRDLEDFFGLFDLDLLRFDFLGLFDLDRLRLDFLGLFDRDLLRFDFVGLFDRDLLRFGDFERDLDSDFFCRYWRFLLLLGDLDLDLFFFFFFFFNLSLNFSIDFSRSSACESKNFKFLGPHTRKLAIDIHLSPEQAIVLYISNNTINLKHETI